MRRPNFDADYRATVDRIASQRRIIGRCTVAAFGFVLVGLLIATYLACTTSPEAIGAWFGRVAAGFRGAQ